MDQQQYEHYDGHRLNELNIVEVARRLNIKLHRAGVNFKTNCLWHPDKNPSLVLYNKPGNQHCHCYTCGAHHSVIDLAMEAGGWTFKDACQWLSQEFGIGTTQSWRSMSAPQQRNTEPTQDPDYHYIPMEMVEPLVSVNNSLCQCLMHMAHTKDAVWTPEAVEWQAEEYRLGCYELWGRDDWTVFPCIDYWNRVCNLKVQHYDTAPESGRFGHDDIGNSYWLASMWLKDGKLKLEDGQKLDDVAPHHVGGGGGQGDGRRVPDDAPEHSEFRVVGAEIMPPLAHAVRLIDRQERNIRPFGRRNESGRTEPLGYDVHQAELPGLHPLHAVALLLRRKRSINK